MRLTKTIFTAILILFTATGFAAKKEKDLICHVGNEYGPGGEVYLDDPGCVPVEENGYFCPDAGKIDLIEVAKAAKHLNNTSHTFEFAAGEFISDYLPADKGASGVGNEDSDLDGVDDGCEPPAPVSCPCWTNDVLNSIDGFLADGTPMSFYTQGPPFNVCQEELSVDDDYFSNFVIVREGYVDPNSGDTFDYCQSAEFNTIDGYTRVTVQREYYGEGDLQNTMTLEELQACTAQVQACVARVTE